MYIRTGQIHSNTCILMFGVKSKWVYEWGKCALVFVSDIASIHSFHDEEYKKSLQNICTNVAMATCFCHRMSLFSFSLYLHLYRTTYIAYAFRLWWVFRTCVIDSTIVNFPLSMPYTHEKKTILVNHIFCHHLSLNMVGWWRWWQ